MPNTEKEKAAISLSTILERELPSSVKFAWDDNYLLKFTYNGEVIFSFPYAEATPTDSDARQIIKCVTDKVNS